MKRALAFLFVATLLLVTIATVIATSISVALTGPRMAPTSSGVIDRTNRTDRLKAPALHISVASECRSA